jgi:BirA family biotin operon repressor/biotin-[acetyl-CoA-carboxylase] ligase
MRFRRIEYEWVDSTNERAFAALAEGRGAHGDVHLARGQTAGRGRLGRRWHSALGEGLYLSVLLRPPQALPHPAALTLAGGLAVFDAVRGLGAAELALRWPNDVELCGAKLAGVLVESRGFDPRAPHYVLGIGVNVAQREFPPELSAERPVTSLALAGLELGVEELGAGLLEALGQRLDQAFAQDAGLVADFEQALNLVGQPVEVEGPSGTLRGTFAGLALEQGVSLATGQGPRTVPLAHVRGLRRIVQGRSQG